MFTLNKDKCAWHPCVSNGLTLATPVKMFWLRHCV